MFAPKMLALAALLGAALPGCRVASEAVAAEEGLVEAEVATVGFDHFTQSPIVLLRSRETGQTVPIWIGIAEAQAIARKLHGLEIPRPLTHDLTVTLLQAAGAVIEEVTIHDLRQGVYYGAIKLRVPNEDEPVEIDSRPSDALALALRFDARIFVAEKILQNLPEFHFVPPEAAEQVVRVLGLTVVTPTAEQREQYALGERAGVMVSSVSDQVRARGLRQGDLIIDVNGATPETPIDFLEAILDIPSGRAIRLRYLRDGEEAEVEILAEEPSTPSIRI
jgi:uncharacterized protein